MRQLPLALALILLPAAAAAQTYETVGVVPKTSALLVDVASIAVGAATSTATIIFISVDPNPLGAVVQRTDYEFDCGGKRQRYLGSKHYNAKMELLREHAAPGGWLAVGANAGMNRLQDIVCANRRRSYGDHGDLAAVAKRWREQLMNARVRDTFVR